MLKTVRSHEEIVDNLQSEIIFYLSTLMAQGSLTHHQSTQCAAMLHVVNDIERVGDHAMNNRKISRLTGRSNALISRMKPSSELMDLFRRVDEIISDAVNALEANGRCPLAQDVWEKEKVIDQHWRLNSARITLSVLTEGTLLTASAVIYIEVLDNLERLADHAVNLADAVRIKTLSP